MANRHFSLRFHLDDEECNYAGRELHTALSRGEESESIWHRGRLDGSSDFNRVYGTFAGPPTFPISRRIRHVNEWSQLCQVADAVTDELNEKRQEKKRPLIPTMREAIADLAREEHFDDLFAQLAALKKHCHPRTSKKQSSASGIP